MPRDKNIQTRRGTAALWTSVNPILADGERGFETDTRKAKTGNGILSWTALSYEDADTLDGNDSLYFAAQTQLVGVARAAFTTGITTTADTFTLIALDVNTLRIAAIAGVYFEGLATASSLGIVSFPQTDVPLAAEPLGLGVDGNYIRYLSIDSTGARSYTANPTAGGSLKCQLGVLYIKRVAGVNSFIEAPGPNTLNVYDKPELANIGEFTLAMTAGMISSVGVTANANLTWGNATGTVDGLSVNWKQQATPGPIVHQISVDAANPMQFARISPANNTGNVPATQTTVDPTVYWNGAALVSPGNNNSATVQRLVITTRGKFVMQYGEAAYSNFTDAVDSISTAPFTPIFPEDFSTEVLRIAITKAATNLTDINTVRIIYAGQGGGGGSGSATTPSLQAVYNASGGSPLITTSAAVGPFALKNGAALDTVTVYEGRNIAGDTTWAMQGDGFSRNTIGGTAPAISLDTVAALVRGGTVPGVNVAATNAFLSILSGTTGKAGINLGDTANETIGSIFYDSANDSFNVITASGQRLQIAANLSTLIGTLQANGLDLSIGDRIRFDGATGNSWITSPGAGQLSFVANNTNIFRGITQNIDGLYPAFDGQLHLGQPTGTTALRRSWAALWLYGSTGGGHAKLIAPVAITGEIVNTLPALTSNLLGTAADGATTAVLVGGGTGVLPVWTTATGTGAPVRAGSPTLTGNAVADVLAVNALNLSVGEKVTFDDGTGAYYIARIAPSNNIRIARAEGGGFEGSVDVTDDAFTPGAVDMHLGAVANGWESLYLEEAGSTETNQIVSPAITGNKIQTLPALTSNLLGTAADGATTEVLVGGGTGALPVWTAALNIASIGATTPGTGRFTTLNASTSIQIPSAGASALVTGGCVASFENGTTAPGVGVKVAAIGSNGQDGFAEYGAYIHLGSALQPSLLGALRWTNNVSGTGLIETKLVVGSPNLGFSLRSLVGTEFAVFGDAGTSLDSNSIATVSGRFSTYAGTPCATFSMGVPPIRASALGTIQTASSTIFTYTPPATAGRYRLSATITATTGTNTGSYQVTVDYRNSQGAVQTGRVLGLMDDAGGIAATRPAAVSKEYSAVAKTFTINDAATPIVVKVVNTGSVSYTAAATLEQLA